MDGLSSAFPSLRELEVSGCAMLRRLSHMNHAPEGGSLDGEERAIRTEWRAAATLLRHAADSIDDWHLRRQDAPAAHLEELLDGLSHSLEVLTLRLLRHPVQLTLRTQLASLLRCSQLRELTIDGHTLDTFEGLEQLYALETLSLQLSARVRVAAGHEMGVVGCACDLAPLAFLRRLRVLHLTDPAGITRPGEGRSTIRTLGPLAECTALEELVLDGVHASPDAASSSDAGIEDLVASGCWPHLATLSLRGCPIRRPWRLGESPHAAALTALDVSGTIESGHLRRHPGRHIFHTPRPGLLELPACMPRLRQLVAEGVLPHRWIPREERDSFALAFWDGTHPVYETSLSLDQRLRHGCRLVLDFEANLSAALGLERLHALPPLPPPPPSPPRSATAVAYATVATAPRTRGSPPPLPGRPAPLDVSETEAGVAARRAAGWDLRRTDGVVTGFVHAPSGHVQLERPWVDGPRANPIGGWWSVAHEWCTAAVRSSGRARDGILSGILGTYDPDQSSMRSELLETCRGGVDAEYVNEAMMRAVDGMGRESEGGWRGLPDVSRHPLPADARIDVDRLEALLERGAFPDCSDTYGRTPVVWACLHRDAVALHLLLRAGASPQHVPWDRACVPPIFWATYFGAEECILLLSRFGAVPFCEGGAGSHYPSSPGMARTACYSLESFRAAFGAPSVSDAVTLAMREAAESAQSAGARARFA